MKPMEFPRWKVDVTVNGDVVRTYYETATTKEAAIAKAKHKLRGSVSSAGAFKFTAKRDGESHATRVTAPSQFSQLHVHDHFNTHPGTSPARYMKVDASTSITLLGPYKGQHVERAPSTPVWPAKAAHATKYSKKTTAKKLDRDIAEALHKKHGAGCGCAHATEAAGWKHDRDDAQLFGRSGAQQGHTKAETLKYASEYGFTSKLLRDAVSDGWEAEKRDRSYGWEG